MHPDDIAQYLREIGRCLKPGGRCLATFFLLNSESKAAITHRDSTLAFRFPVGEHALTTTSRTPEDAIAIDEFFIREAYKQSRLRIEGEVYRGSWQSNPKAISIQDIVVAIAE